MKQQFLLLLFLALGQFSLQAQHSDWGHYFNSLGVNSVTEGQGCLWLATDRGVFKINKNTAEVTALNKTNSALPSEHIQTITRDQADNIWIGTYDLALVKAPANGGNLEVIDYPALSGGLVVYSSAVANNGHVWMGTNQGLLEYNGNTWNQHPIVGLTANMPLWSIAISTTGKVYAASNNLLSYENGVWEELRDTGITTAAYSNAYICLENDTTVWYFGDGNIAFKYDGQAAWQRWYYNAWSGSPSLPAEPNISSMKMQITSNGDIYYNTYNKNLVYFDGQNWQTDTRLAQSNIYNIATYWIDETNDKIWAFEQNDGEFLEYSSTGSITRELADCKNFGIFSLFSNDQLGNLHLSDYWGGIYEIHDNDWQVTHANIGGPQPSYEETVFDAENERWFLSRIDGEPAIIEQQGSNWIVHNAASTNGLLPTNASAFDYYYYFHLAANKDGVIWMIDENYIVYEYKNNTWTAHSSFVSPNNYTSPLRADADGNFWWSEYNINTNNFTLKKYDGSSVSAYPYPQNYTGYLSKPAVDDLGNVFVFTNNGYIAKFDGTNWTDLSFGSSAAIPSIILTRDDKIYVGTDSHGLFVYDGNGNWDNYNQLNSGLTSDGVRQMAFDDMGNLWFSNNGYNVLDVWYLGQPSSIVEPSADAAFELYPNPATSFLMLRGELQGNEQIRIINAQGQVVATHSAQAANEQQIDIENLSSGAYWLQVGQQAKAFVVR